MEGAYEWLAERALLTAVRWYNGLLKAIGSLADNPAVCSAELIPNRRYPRYGCSGCAGRACSADGRPLQFGNVDISGAFTAQYSDTGEMYPSDECFIEGVKCLAGEAKFGSIVIQPVAREERA